MSLSAHLQSLKKRHDVLSEEVEQAQRAPGTSDFQINALKKEKLKLKDEIIRLSGQGA